MQWPQITVMVLIAVSLSLTLALHGKESKNNFFAKAISAAIWIWLLIEGGFFS